MRRGGGVGYDFSAIRPPRAMVHARTRAPAVRSPTCACSTELRNTGISRARRGRADGMMRCDHPISKISSRQARRIVVNFNMSWPSPTRSCARWKPTPRSSSARRRTVRQGKRLSAPGWFWVLPHGARARVVRPDHAFDVQPRRTRRVFIDRVNATTICRTRRRSRRLTPASRQTLFAYAARMCLSVNCRLCRCRSR